VRPPSLAGHLGLGQADRPLRRQHITIDGDTGVVLHRGRAQALRGLRLHVQARGDGNADDVARQSPKAIEAAKAVTDKAQP